MSWCGLRSPCPGTGQGLPRAPCVLAWAVLCQAGSCVLTVTMACQVVSYLPLARVLSTWDNLNPCSVPVETATPLPSGDLG